MSRTLRLPVSAQKGEGTMRVWLVQRASFKTSDITKVEGIDSLLRYDYMGSSEFECGGLGESYRRIVAARSDYGVVDTGIMARDGRALRLFCRENQGTEARDAINDIVSGNVRLKERVEMSGALRPDEQPPTRTEFWWDIEND